MPDDNKFSVADALNIASPVLGAVEGVANFFSNRKKEREDEEALQRLKRPFYKIQDEYFQNRNIAANIAESGLPESTKNYVTQENQRGLSAGIDAILSGGGSPSDVSKLFSAYSNSINSLGAKDAESKISNIQYFMGANKDLAGQKNIQFGVNELQPYEEKLKQLNENLKVDQTNKFGAVDTAIGSLGALGTTLSNKDLYKMLFGAGTTHAINDGRVDTGAATKISTGDLKSGTDTGLHTSVMDEYGANYNKLLARLKKDLIQ